MAQENVKNGEVFDRDEDGNLVLCESFVNSNGDTFTTRTLVVEGE